jgi:5-methyltetrahydrofolate--homocysteine methyltransferase
MPKSNLRKKIMQDLSPAGKGDVLILDGAMGTQLISRGAAGGACNEYLNIQSPDIVREVHKAYIKVGSDAILTNTFGASRLNLARHNLADKVNEINKAASHIARQAAGPDKFVLGDIGPTGSLLEPLGELKPQQCKDAFVEQAAALLAGGVDGFIIETMTALDELAIAVEAVKSVSGDLPVLASMAFDKTEKDFRTMMGISVEKMVSTIVPLGVDAIGFNCGSASLDEYVMLAKRFVSAVNQANGNKRNIAILAEPNAGKPQVIDYKTVYMVNSQDFASAAEKIYVAGVTIIGGCCGTGPDHIGAAAKKLK